MTENGPGKRRSLRWFSLALGILLAVIMVLFLGLRTDFFARIAGRLVSEHFLAGTQFVVSVDKIEGSIFQDVTLRGMKIHYRGVGPSFDLFRADELSIRYDLLALMDRSRRVKEISMTKPLLRLKADSTGAFILPSFGAGSGDLPAFDIKKFSIEDGHVIVQAGEKSDALNGVNIVGSLRSGGDELDLRIAQGAAVDAGRNFSVRSFKGEVKLVRDASAAGAGGTRTTRVTLDSLAVVLDESAFVASGTVVPSTRFFDVVVDAEPISIDEIKRIFQIETSHTGEFKGTLTVKGTPDRFRLSGTVSGVLSGYALSDFGVSLLRDNNVIRLDSLAGKLNGARVRGSGRYTLGRSDVLSVDLDVRGLDLSRGFVPKEKMPETRFNGAVTLEYRVREEALTFAVDLDEGDFLGFPFAAAVVRGSYANDTLRIDDGLLSHPTHTVSGRGTLVGGSAVSFLFVVECAARDTLFGYFKIQDYRGDARLNGRWEGTLDSWDIRMNGTCANLTYQLARVPEGEVKLAIENRREKYAVLFDLEGPGCRIGPVDFTGVSLSLEFRDEVTNIKRLMLKGDDLTADIVAEARLAGGETIVRFKECSLDALGEKWLGAGAFTVFFSDTAVRFDDIQLHSKAGAAYADGILALKSKTVHGRFSFNRLGLDLLNRAGVTKTPFEGRARGLVRFAGSYTDPELGIDVQVEKGRIDSFVIDTLLLRADYAKSRFAIDSLVVASPSGSLALSGQVSGVPLRELLSHPGSAIRNANVAVESACRNLDIAPLLSLAGIRVFSGGRLSGSLSVTDSLVHPLVTFKGQIENLVVSSFRIPSIDGGVKIDRGGLTAEGTLYVSKSHEGSFRGAVPLVPARFLYSLDRDRSVSLEIDLGEGDLGDVSRVTELVAEAAGRYSGRLSVTGTVGSPHLYGDLRLQNASFRLSGMEERYREVNATVQLDDTLITIKELTGREGKKGTVACTGWITLRGWRPSEYRLSVNGTDFVLASLPNVLAIVSGKVSLGTRVVNGTGIPLLTGSCTVKQSEVSYDLGSFSSSTEGGAVEEPTWLAAIDLKVPGNTWIRTPDARVELQGNVTLYHDAKGTYLRGELNLLRGWYNIYNNKFTITSGQLQFVTAGSSRPVIDIEAETHDPEGRKIYLTLQWHQDDLQPRLSLRHEDSGYSETDIWKMLGGGVVTAEGQGASWSAGSTAQSIAANYIERVLNSQMQGLTIELESARGTSQSSGLENILDTKIAIGKYLSQGLYVKYKQGLSISSARAIEVEYRISNLFVLHSEVIRYFDKAIQGNSPRSSDEINVDLKLRWEF